MGMTKSEVERVVMEFSSQLAGALAEQGHSRASLARQLGQSRASVTQALRSGSNLTIRRMVEFAGVCGYEVHIDLRPRRQLRSDRHEDCDCSRCLPPTY